MNAALKAAAGVLGGSAAFIATTAAAYMPFVIYKANMNYRDDCEYLLILGGDIIGADTPSPQLFERMKCAAVYLSEHSDVIAVPCGGCFRKQQKKSEAAIIADYLIKEGVSPDRILLEDSSTTTFENFKFGIPIIEKHAGRSADEIKIAFPPLRNKERSARFGAHTGRGFQKVYPRILCGLRTALPQCSESLQKMI